MKTIIPNDFQSISPEILDSFLDEYLDKFNYWIHLKNGKSKKYTEATNEEMNDYITSIGALNLKDDIQIGLSTVKIALLDATYLYQIAKYRDLFGGPAMWDNMPEWQRASRLFEKEKKDKNGKK